MDCSRVRNEDVAERYARRELSEAESLAFELHYFECDECYEVLVAAQGVIDTLRPKGGAPATRRRRPWVPASLAATVLAGTWLAWYLAQGAPGGPVQAPPSGSASPPSSDPTGPAPLPRELTEVAPPAFVVVETRGGADDESLRKAKPHFERGEYAAAAEALRGPWSRSAPASVGFYLGVCELLQGRDAEALTVLERVAEMQDPIYSEPARLYQARARIRSGDLAAARRELTGLSRSSAVGQQARNLLALLAEVEPR